MPSTPSTASPKLSMFARKTGFVIPKNKLSGSLVPIFRPRAYDNTLHQESNNQLHRKTKWGPDLTQDPVVKKGRSLAYQTRVNQIAQQLKSGVPEVQDNQDSLVDAQQADHNSFSPQPDNSEKLELLDTERREAIGEILKLNPSFKAPADYKPVLKEARVHIPVKEYPRYNFVGLIFGPERETQKRFEKEAGAKIKVCGTKASSGEKVEVSPIDEKGIPAVYEELHVDVSADTHEKVDAAVVLIELLITSVSDNLAAGSSSTPVSGDNVNALYQNVTIPYISPPISMNEGTVQSLVRPTQFPPQGQFQYQVPWFPINPAQNPMPQTGFAPPSNSSVPIFNNAVNLQTPPANPLNLPSFFAPPSAQQPTQGLPNPLLGNQPPLAQQNNLLPFPFTGAQPPVTVPSPGPRPLMQPLSSGSAWGPRPGVSQIAPSMGPSPPAMQSAFHSGMTPRPQHPSPRDFMFQHQLQQNSVPQTVNQYHVTQNAPPLRPMMHLPPSQAPSFRLAGPNPTPPMQGYPGPHTGNQMGQPQALMSSASFSGNPNAISAPPRHLAFTSTNPVGPAPPYSQLGPRGFNPSNRMPHEYDTRQWNPMHSRPENLMVPNQRFASNQPFGHNGGHQIYDQFSPSPAPVGLQQQGSNQARAGKQENDPEYEDLMASVGVK